MEQDLGQASAPETPLPSESDDLARVRAALYPESTKPRGPDGKFLKAEQPQPQEPPQEPEQGQEQPPEPEQAAQEDEQPVTWEELKDYKIKLPQKRGNEEWEEEVTLEQLRNERMMRNDYNLKAQEIATERTKIQQEQEAFRQNLRQQAINELATYEQALLHLVAPQYQNVDLNQLARENPAEWAAAMQTQNNYSQMLTALRSQRAQLQEEQDRVIQQQRAEAVKKAAAQLQTKIPNWNSELDQALSKMAVENYGFRPEELSVGYVPIADARTLELVHDAYQWRQLQAQKPAVTKKVAEVPKVLRPGAKQDPGAAKARSMQELRDRLRKSGGKDENAIVSILRNKMFGS